MVRMPSSPRIGAQCFSAGWCSGAHRKPTPASPTQREIVADGHLELDAELGEHVGGARLGGDAAVAVLGDLDAGAGRDQRRAGGDIVGAVAVAAGADDVDGVGRHLDAVHAARSICAAPVISSTVSPRTRSAIRKAPICAGVAAPAVIWSSAVRISSSVSVAPPETFWIRWRSSCEGWAVHGLGSQAAWRAARTLRRRGAHAGDLEEVGEQRVAVLGGDALGVELHAVHGMRLVLQAHDRGCRRAVSAVTARQSGRLARSTMSEW